MKGAPIARQRLWETMVQRRKMLRFWDVRRSLDGCPMVVRRNIDLGKKGVEKGWWRRWHFLQWCVVMGSRRQ